MKKQTILKTIFLSIFILSSALNLKSSPPKQIIPQISQKEFNTIESFFEIDNMAGLLKLVANKLTNFITPSISSMEECSHIFNNAPHGKVYSCSLDRTTNPQYRKAFEDKILEEFEKLLPNLIKDNKLSFTYTSFACGFLFQDFVILNKIVRLIQTKYPEIQINIKINLIDLMAASNHKNYDKFKNACKQLKWYLENKGVEIVILIVDEKSTYITECTRESGNKSDIITACDFATKNSNSKDVKDLILNCLNKNGLFFFLSKIESKNTNASSSIFMRYGYMNPTNGPLYSGVTL